MAGGAKVKGIAGLEAAVGDLGERLAALEVEQEKARQKAEQAEAAWRSALADQRLGEGGKAAVTKVRAELDAARENVLGVDGAVAEIGRRLALAEETLLAARLAALVERADKGAAQLGRCVQDLLGLDEAAGKIREKMGALTRDLLEVRGEHIDLDPEGRSPGEIEKLAGILFSGLGQSGSLNERGHILLSHLELAGFISSWRGGPTADRLLGGGANSAAQRRERE